MVLEGAREMAQLLQKDQRNSVAGMMEVELAMASEKIWMMGLRMKSLTFSMCLNEMMDRRSYSRYPILVFEPSLDVQQCTKKAEPGFRSPAM